MHFEFSAKFQATLMLTYVLYTQEKKTYHKYKLRTPFKRIKYIEKWLENDVY